MVENVEEVSPKLHGQALGESRVLVDGDVPLFERGAGQRISAKIPVVARPRLAVTGKPAVVVGIDARRDCARHGERAQL